MQDIVTNFYSDVKNFPTVTNEGEYPQSAAAILDPNGKIIALAGGIGEKRGMREFNRATDAYRQCGSSIKPISAYLQAVERDVVTWSTKIDDGPVDLGTHTLVNHYSGYLGPITVDEALQRSTNTVPYKLIQQIGPKSLLRLPHREARPCIPSSTARSPTAESNRISTSSRWRSAA